MASSPKIDYPSPQNYIAKFSYNNKASFLLLVYNINREFQFVDLGTGQLKNLVFESVEAAEQWLYQIAEVYEKNAICTTYVP